MPESLDIADSKAQVTDAPTMDRTIVLNPGTLLVEKDLVARLLPMAERLSVIQTLVGGIATLDVALNDLPQVGKLVAFGNLPRVAKVTFVPASPIIVTVDTPGSFHEGDVVVRLGDHPENAPPAVITSVDDSGTLEFSTAITGLAAGDTLGVVHPASTVATIAGLDITVAHPAQFHVMDVAVRLGSAVETSTPAMVVGKRADGTLALSAGISGLQPESPLGVARAAGIVQSVMGSPGEVTIQVDNDAPFRAKDLVAKITQGGMPSVPVRVKTINTRSLTLSGAISGLVSGDTIGAADFRVRATVLGVADKTVTIADATVFPTGSVVAGINDVFEASLPAVVKNSSGNTLTLDQKIEGLGIGDVIGLCAFPAMVQVQSIPGDRTIDRTIMLRDSGVVHALDVVSAPSWLALVSEATGSSIRLAGAIPSDLGVDAWLAIATVRGVVEAKPGTISNTVVVDQPSRLREGDFLASITGWRQVMAGSSGIALIEAVNGNKITVSPLLDGVMLNDTIGLANVTPLTVITLPLLWLRLKMMPDLRPGDEVLLVGLDRLQGETRSMFVSVWATSNNFVLLALQGAPRAFAFRPEDISASVLFVRGSALGMIEKQDLFVSWLACGDPDPMPKPCAGVDVSDSPCSQVKE